MKLLKSIAVVAIAAVTFSSCAVRVHETGRVWVRGHYAPGPYGGRVWVGGHYN